ncbi:MAG: YcaO-like family protein [Nitriliruptoraceae bacterium]|nr:YcaO-like family protein [Nitriliruptoraceae bacterium]
MDPRNGPILGLRTERLAPPAPTGTVVTTATLAVPDGLGPSLDNRLTAGCALGDPRRARTAAIGEALERWSAATPVPVTRTASAEQLRHEGVAHVDPVTLALHHPVQLAAPGFPFHGPDRSQATTWVDAHRAGPRTPVLVPTSLVALTPEPSAPHYPVNAGVAAHRDLRRATLAAVAEVVERDALASTWEHPGRRFGVLPLPVALQAVRGLSLHLVPQRRGIPVVLAALRDLDHERVTIGCAATARWVDAAVRATCEAALLHRAAGMLDDPRSALWRELADAEVLLPHRRDRDYASLLGPERREIGDPLVHLQLALDPTIRAGVEDRLRGPDVRPPRDAPGALQALVRDALVVDRTTADVRRLGWRVARAILPGARATAPWPFAFLGGPDPIDPRDRVLVPLPHA